jgi:peroxiredoxin
VELIGPDGVPTTLAEAAAGGPAVVVFYRGAWWPYCNITLSNYQTFLLPALSDRAVRLMAVSPHRHDGSLTVQQKHDRAFAVLLDPGNVLARQMRIATALTRGTRCATQIGDWT